MQKYLVINATKGTLATTGENIEEATFLANSETVKTNNIHLVAEVKYACRTKYVQIPLEDLKEV